MSEAVVGKIKSQFDLHFKVCDLILTWMVWLH